MRKPVNRLEVRIRRNNKSRRRLDFSPPKKATIAPPDLDREYTLSEAKKIPGSLIYGLRDGDGVFYIGKTTNAKSRFSSYANPAKVQLNLQKRLARAGDDLRVVILEHNPADLGRAEREWIEARGDQLVNLHTGDGEYTARAREDIQAKKIGIAITKPWRRRRDRAKDLQERALIDEWMKSNSITKVG
jgi:hypothetical protein